MLKRPIIASALVATVTAAHALTFGSVDRFATRSLCHAASMSPPVDSRCPTTRACGATLRSMQIER
jgi:hypothetical protein